MKAFLYLLLLSSLMATPVLAQLGMGGTPHPSAALDVQATNKAFYPPRLTTAQRKAIVSPQAGAFVFDTDKQKLYMFDGQNWFPMAFGSANAILTTGRTASDGATGDSFGYSVSISGDYALVGAAGDDIGANVSQGSAYVFFRANGIWTQQAKLTASDGAADDGFGTSVSISGDYALVGAPFDDIESNLNQGSAYVFVRSGTTWTQQAKLTTLDGGFFGESVSISGDYALVGSIASGAGGAAYVFVRSGTAWTQQAELTSGDGVFTDRFGESVSLSGEYALIGDSDDKIGANTRQGSAYVFLRSGSTWTQQAKLTASDGAVEDRFGWSVSISGDYALVGALNDDVGLNANQGSAYVFARSGTTWSQQAKLTASNGAAGDNFGSSVSLSGDYALVGADSDFVGDNSSQGSAYLYKRTSSTWPLANQIINDSPGATSDGTSVSIFNGSFVIGGSGFESLKGKVSFGVVEN